MFRKNLFNEVGFNLIDEWVMYGMDVQQHRTTELPNINPDWLQGVLSDTIDQTEDEFKEKCIQGDFLSESQRNPQHQPPWTLWHFGVGYISHYGNIYYWLWGHNTEVFGTLPEDNMHTVEEMVDDADEEMNEEIDEDKNNGGESQ